MQAAPVPKTQVACQLLERAIELHLRGDSYYASLHLGGAAEELLSVTARELGIEPTFDQMKKAMVAISKPSTKLEEEAIDKWAHDRMNEAKNSVKHKRGARDVSVAFAPEEESYDVIDRAISTYYQLFSALELRHIASIQDFDERRRSEQTR